MYTHCILNDNQVLQAESLFCPFFSKPANEKMTKIQFLIELIKEFLFFIPKIMERNKFIENFSKQVNVITISEDTLENHSKKLEQLNVANLIQSLITEKYGYKLNEKTKSEIKNKTISLAKKINECINFIEENKRRALLQVTKPQEPVALPPQEPVALLPQEPVALLPQEPVVQEGNNKSNIKIIKDKIIFCNDTVNIKISSSSWRMPSLFTITTFALLIIARMGMTTPFENNDLCQNRSYQYICEGNLGIPRIQMPQVSEEVMKNFTSTYGCTSNRTTVFSDELIPIQKEMNQDKVMKMVQSTLDGFYNPCEREILVAREGEDRYVLDGHHGYAACRILSQYGEKYGRQSVIEIEGDPLDIVKKLNGHPGVTNANL